MKVISLDGVVDTISRILRARASRHYMARESEDHIRQGLDYSAMPLMVPYLDVGR
jgi:hypothetical protein